MNLRHALWGFVLTGCIAANAGTYRTNTVEGLIWLLSQHDAVGDVIELEPGDYRMPAEPACTNSAAGYASIYVHRQRIRGLGVSPADGRLIGTGA